MLWNVHMSIWIVRLLLKSYFWITVEYSLNSFGFKGASLSWVPFKKHELLNLGARKFSLINKLYIFRCIVKIFCVEFQREFHKKYLAHTLKETIFIQHWKFRSFQIYELVNVFERLPRILSPVSPVVLFGLSCHYVSKIRLWSAITETCHWFRSCQLGSSLTHWDPWCCINASMKWVIIGSVPKPSFEPVSTYCKLNQQEQTFIQNNREKGFQQITCANVVCKMLAILFRPQCVNCISSLWPVSLTHWPLGDVAVLLKVYFANSLYRITGNAWHSLWNDFHVNAIQASHCKD